MLPIISIGSLHLPTYLLIISLTYCFGLLWVVRRAENKSSEFHYDRQTNLDIALLVMLGGFFGARIFHVLYEAPQYYWDDPWRILQFWRGGFVFYGGAIGAGLAFYTLARKRRLSIPHWLDLYAPIFPFGYAIGRLSCLAAGCCFGHQTEVPWAIIFPQGVEAPAGVPIHPTQLYAFFWEMGLFGGLLFLERWSSKRSSFSKNHPSLQTNRLPTGGLFTIWLIGHSLGRILMESFRADHRGPQLSLPLALGTFDLSVSSIISILILAVASLSLAIRIRKS